MSGVQRHPRLGAARSRLLVGKPPAVPAAPRSQVQPQYVVVLDAAHGDGDTGAQFNDKLLEKDLTLGFSVRLKQALASGGIQVVTTRDADVQVPMVARGETGGGARPRQRSPAGLAPSAVAACTSP